MDDVENIQFDNPLVSIIIPIYKTEKYLRRCLDSVVNQTYRNLEIILVDDGSPDGCGKICDEYAARDGRVKVIHQENAGPGAARNAGLDIATGEYISFVDSDDWVTSDMAEYAVKLAASENADIVSLAYILTSKEKPAFKETNDIKVFDSKAALEFFVETGMTTRTSECPVWSKLFKAELFDEIRFPEGIFYEDIVVNVELIKKSRIYVKSSKVCNFYFRGGTSTTRSKYKLSDDRYTEEWKEVRKKVSKENDNIKRLADQRAIRCHFSLLAKIALYGFSDDIPKKERKQIAKEFTRQVRKERRTLLSSGMPVSHKLLLLILCANYKLLWPVKIFQTLKLAGD